MADPTDLPPGLQSLLQVHAVNGAQRQADNAQHYSDNLRYQYLTQNGVQEANATRMVDESGSGRSRVIDNTSMPSYSIPKPGGP